ncbi:hypothetical protein J7M28_06560 [bacterium]|nr:hypothetical protein [bacterium]
MNDISKSSETELLQDLCRKYGIDAKVVEELIKIGKQFQRMERRHGIYDELRRCIRDSIDARENEVR